MRALLAVFFLATLGVAGCVGNEPEPTSDLPPAPDPTAHLTSHRDGLHVAVPSEFAGLDIALRPTGRSGGEPNIGITSTGAMFVNAGQVTLKSTDLGITWTEAFNMTAFWGPLADPPIPNDTPGVGDPVRGFTRSSDPMLWVDPATDRIFVDHMTGLHCSKMFMSDDEGESWLAQPFDCGIPGNDHQKVATGAWGPIFNALSANPAYPSAVYYCYNHAAVAVGTGNTMCATSRDGGLTFETDVVASSSQLDGCGGINGHPAAAPDGTLFVPLNLGCDGPTVAVSVDNGHTFTVRTGPTEHGAEEIDPDITVTPDGTAYMLYRGADHLQYLVRSMDAFVTFEGPWRVSPEGITSTVFTVITSGDDGRIAMAYLGTRDTEDEPSLAENETRWHLFETLSLDAAAASPTFTTMQVTSDDAPAQIGCVWLNGGGNPCRNMLDFIDMARTPDGLPVVVFSDGCAKDCDGNATATNEQSRSRIVTVAVLAQGPSLLAAEAAPATTKF